jgi:hypothetical protein
MTHATKCLGPDFTCAYCPGCDCSCHTHAIEPKLIPMMHRYQCDVCKRFVRYDEELGKWLHQSPRG